MLIDRVYMPAEIAVNSTAEKIQSSIFLKYIYIHMCIHRYHGTQGPGAVEETIYSHRCLGTSNWKAGGFATRLEQLRGEFARTHHLPYLSSSTVVRCTIGLDW